MLPYRDVFSKLSVYYKVLVNYIGVLISYYRRSRKAGKYKNTVVLNFRKIDRERNYAQLIFFFYECGYQVILIHHPLFLGNMLTYGKHMVNLPNVLLKFRPPNDADSVAYFYDTLSDRNINYRKQIFISDDVFSFKRKLNELELVPFPMIPRVYYQGQYRLVDTLKDTAKSIRLYFSGNQNRLDYDTPVFKTFLEKLNRVEIIEALREELKPDEVLFSNTTVGLSNQIGKYKNRFVCHYWTRVSLKSNRIEGRISNDEWLPTLAKVDFFLACPGFIQPMCHNQIEAMSLGVILVLEHPEFFDPPLEHMENCVVFHGKDELIEKVRWVLNADEQTIAKMRGNVFKYYNDYLRPISFCRKIEGKEEGEHTLYVITSDSAYRELVLEQ